MLKIVKFKQFFLIYHIIQHNVVRGGGRGFVFGASSVNVVVVVVVVNVFCCCIFFTNLVLGSFISDGEGKVPHHCFWNEHFAFGSFSNFSSVCFTMK